FRSDRLRADARHDAEICHGLGGARLGAVSQAPLQRPRVFRCVGTGRRAARWQAARRRRASPRGGPVPMAPLQTECHPREAEKTVSFLQAYYTSATLGLSGGQGFQFHAATPGIDSMTLAQMERLGVYVPPRSAPVHPSPEELERLPVALA